MQGNMKLSKNHAKIAYFSASSTVTDLTHKNRIRDIGVFKAVLEGEDPDVIASTYGVQKIRLGQIGSKIALVVFFRTQDRSELPKQPPSFNDMKKNPTFWLKCLADNLDAIKDTNPARTGAGSKPFNMLPDCRT